MGRMSTTPKPPRRPRLTYVEEVEQLTPGMVRIVLGGPGLEDFPADQFTDHYVKLQIPPAGASYAAPFDPEEVKATLPREQWPRVRTYSVRAWDAGQRRLTIDFVVHGDRGVAGPWAAAAQVGDTLQLVGPGGDYAPDPGADWHLMVGDAAVIPAIAASLERVPAGAPVHVVIQVDGPEERQQLRTDADLRLTWVHDEEALLSAVRELEFPAGAVHAFVHGEAGAVREVRRHLLADRGVPREALSVSGYWKRTLADEDWRAVKRDWNAQVEQDVA
ncbi:siderophore-interacting protein [Conexibacter woesei]|uniref:FAD-binding 9 siderophore-interacting domain protein n=1 Tax=Conexibacter woesei (strain DSM 14684 / CCUG 47730 / CIP 108061 / JCM 11494 / NBRC 100937 / ID131577) TaxID=469383 RepID=D3FBH6_CONWI|nr:FAD-binding 9 siderophore-interacting domain protein [Conexibacter woesei DSM 14684]